MSISIALNEAPPRKALVVVPTYNEADNIRPFIEAVAEIGAADLLIVDDASPDGTAEIVSSAAATAPIRVWLMRRDGKLGLGTAYVDGFNWALTNTTYRIFIEMDADLSHDPKDLPRLIEAAKKSGIAVGSRYIPGGSAPDWSASRKLLSSWANRYVAALLGSRHRGFRVADATAGFVAWRRDAATAVMTARPASNGYAFQVETKLMAAEAGFTITELPIMFSERRQGKSKIDLKIILEGMLLPWKMLLRK